MRSECSPSCHVECSFESQECHRAMVGRLSLGVPSPSFAPRSAELHRRANLARPSQVKQLKCGVAVTVRAAVGARKRWKDARNVAEGRMTRKALLLVREIRTEPPQDVDELHERLRK